MSNKSKHTPGPWRITNCIDDKNGSFYILGTDESAVDMPLAVTRHGPEWANVKLMYAAPELLHACELAKAEFQKRGRICDCENMPAQCLLCAVNAAIAKATA